MCFVNPFGTGGVFNQHSSRADGPRRKITAAVGADAGQALFNAVAAEGALKAADHRIERIGRQVDIAAFAIRF